MSRSNPLTTHDNAGIASWKFKMRAEIHSYEDCALAMAELGKDDFAPIGPHMTLIREGHANDFDMRSYAIELYSTKIIRYYSDGTFSVDNGGFATPTTMYRLNAVLPPNWHVFHERKLLRLSAPGRESIYPATHDRRIAA